MHGGKLWTVTGPQLRRKGVESFALQQLDCVERKMHNGALHWLAERQNCHQLRVNICKKLISLKHCVRSQITRLKLQKSFCDLEHGASL